MGGIRMAWRLVLALLAAGSCGATEVAVPGSGDCEFILARLAAEFEKAHPGHKVVVPASTGSTGGIRAVIDRQAALARVARPLKPDEASAGLKSLPFGRDAVVFAVGERVSVGSLTEMQLADIFAGRVTNWRDVGGEAAAIRLIIREDTDTSLVQLRSRLGAFRNLRFDANAKLVAKTPEMIELLARYKTSIGWATYSAVQAHGMKLKPMAIDGVAPGLESIASGKYPVATEYALVYRDAGLAAEAREFLAFLASPAAHATLRNHGIVPLARK